MREIEQQTGISSPDGQRPAKRRFYYGWVIVGVVALAGVAETAEFHPTLGAFIKPLEEEFGWSRTAIAGAISLGTILGGGVALIVGPLLDRFGPRWIMFGGFLLLGSTIMAMSAVNELWQFYLVMVVGRVVIQGAVGVAVSVTVSKWFVRQRGRAVALGNIGVRFGNAFSPAYVQFFITNQGWRTAAIALGLFTWALTLVPTALFLRRQPEDLGLRPDGDEEERQTRTDDQNPRRQVQTLVQQRDYTVRETTRTLSFYLVLFATCASFFVGAGLNLHILPLLTDRGLTPGQAVSIVTIWSLVGVIGTLAGGFERVPIRYILAGSYLTLAAVTGFLMVVDSFPEALVFGVLFGLAFSAMPTLQNIIFADYFGRTHLGAIRGFATPFQMAFNAAGPLAAAFLYDATKSYGLILFVFIAMYGLAAVSMLASRPMVQERVAAELGDHRGNS